MKVLSKYLYIMFNFVEFSLSIPSYIAIGSIIAEIPYTCKINPPNHLFGSSDVVFCSVFFLSVFTCMYTAVLRNKYSEVQILK
jgi:hypothetical protein